MHLAVSRLRRSVPVLGLAVLMTVVTACGTSSQTADTISPGTAPPVGTGHTTASDVTLKAAYVRQVGARVLLTGSGFALYMFVPDHRHGVTCTGLCAASWPPVREAAAGDVHAGSGVDATLLGRDRDPVGGTVVTYDHWPLYTYADDAQPGLAAGQGVDANGGFWYLMRPDGSPLVPSPQRATTAAPTTTSAS
jgi:predicted lipoprotein with Yx(FWY)xxD motif